MKFISGILSTIVFVSSASAQTGEIDCPALKSRREADHARYMTVYDSQVVAFRARTLAILNSIRTITTTSTQVQEILERFSREQTEAMQSYRPGLPPDAREAIDARLRSSFQGAYRLFQAQIVTDLMSQNYLRPNCGTSVRLSQTFAPSGAGYSPLVLACGSRQDVASSDQAGNHWSVDFGGTYFIDEYDRVGTRFTAQLCTISDSFPVRERWMGNAHECVKMDLISGEYYLQHSLTEYYHPQPKFDHGFHYAIQKDPAPDSGTMGGDIQVTLDSALLLSDEPTEMDLKPAFTNQFLPKECREERFKEEHHLWFEARFRDYLMSI